MSNNELDKHEKDSIGVDLTKSVEESNKTRRGPKFKYVALGLVITILSLGAVEFIVLDGVNASRFLQSRPSAIALNYYIEKYENGSNTERIYAMARRLGCHQEIVVYNKEGKPLTKLQYSNGRVYESKILEPADL